MSIQEYELIQDEDERSLKRYRKQCMQEMHERLSFGPTFEVVHELDSGDDFLEVIEKEHRLTPVVVHIYQPGVKGWYFSMSWNRFYSPRGEWAATRLLALTACTCSLSGCEQLNSCLDCLASEYPSVKFCRINAVASGAAERFSPEVSTKKSFTIMRPSKHSPDRELLGLEGVTRRLEGPLVTIHLFAFIFSGSSNSAGLQGWWITGQFFGCHTIL